MTAQDSAIARLEKAGYRFANWIDACDDRYPDGQCAVMVKTISRIQHLSCEVDPDGLCNGKTVDAFLAR